MPNLMRFAFSFTIQLWSVVELITWIAARSPQGATYRRYHLPLLCRGRQSDLPPYGSSLAFSLRTGIDLNVGLLKVRISQGGHFSWDEEVEFTLHRHVGHYHQQLQ